MGLSRICKLLLYNKWNKEKTMEWEIFLRETENCFYNARTKEGFILSTPEK